MARRWAMVPALVIGLCSALAAYFLVLRYEAWALTWHQGSVALGWGPFQFFCADVVPRLAGPPSVTMGMGWGVVTDPILLALLVYRVLSRRPAPRPS